MIGTRPAATGLHALQRHETRLRLESTQCAPRSAIEVAGTRILEHDIGTARWQFELLLGDLQSVGSEGGEYAATIMAVLYRLDQPVPTEPALEARYGRVQPKTSSILSEASIG